jgi:3-hydroxybutyryl-CoA dehydrogenase
MEIKNVTVAGAGVLGSQISWQVAFNGFKVIVYDAFEKGIGICKDFHKNYAVLFENSMGINKEKIEQTFSNISYTSNLKEAIENADILSESIPEIIDIKKKFYSDLSKFAPEKTIFTTNSSTMIPSMFAAETGRPEKFLALHFANPVWKANIAEVMVHEKTDKKYFDIVLNFAKNIGMIPIPIYKEQHGYVLNSLLVPLLKAARTLLYRGVSDPESIDKTWMISTGAKIGPFGIIDMVGMDTVYNIALMNAKINNDEESLKMAEYCKKNYIDKGKKGIKTGEGFYKYPNPAYQRPDFLSPNDKKN